MVTLMSPAAGDEIVQQFQSFLSVEARDERFISFQPLQQRADTFLHSALSQSYPALSSFCRSLLLLSHGQASVERGFSINKEVTLAFYTCISGTHTVSLAL